MNQFKSYRWILFGTVGALYFLAILHRVAPTVIARDMALAFHAEALTLGIISSAYFYFYAVSQPIVGYLSDKAGPRKIMSAFFVLAGCGTVLFALAPDALTATIGRALVGFGAGGVFVCALKLFSRWYPIQDFSVITGLLLTIGGLGGISSTVPLAWVVVSVGWRAAFVGIAVVSFAAAALCWLVTRDKPEERGWPPVSDYGVELSASTARKEKGIGRTFAIFRNFNFWMIFLSFFFTAGVMLTLQGLWAVPYLMDVFHLERISAGSVLMAIPLGFATGGPLLSVGARRMGLHRKDVILGALVLSLIGFIALLFIHERSGLWLVVPIFFILGVAGGGTAPMLLAMNRELFPSELMGTATGLTNMASFLGVALYQPLTGWILQQFPFLQPGVYPFAAYRILILFFLASYAAAVLVTFFMTCGREEEQNG